MRKGIIVIIVVLISVAGLGFFQYKQLEEEGKSSSSLSALTTAFSASTSDVDADMAKVNELLSVLDQVSVLSKLDIDLFKKADYINLRDFSVTLFPAQSVGRTNPFLGIDEGAVQTIQGANVSSGATSPSNPTVPGGVQTQTSVTSAIPAPTQSTPPVQQSNAQSAAPATPAVPQQPAVQQQATQNSPTQSGACDPFVDPTCLNNAAALNAFLNSAGVTP